MPETHLLSKTSFLRGVRCKKSLYLDRFRADLRDPLDPSAQRHMKEGQQVNELARGLFPGGVLAREAPFDFAGALRRTHDLVQAGAQVLYEAGVLHDGVLAFVDILLRSDDAWTLVEVKSSNDVKDHYAWDVALQAYLLEQAGYRLEEVYLAHLNREYTRQGDLNLQALFVLEPMKEMIQEILPQVPGEIEAAKRVLAEGTEPQVGIGPYCDDPDACDFKGYCWRHVPEPSVFDVYYIGKKKAFDLYNQGVVRIEDIPDDYPLQPRSRFHVQAHKSREPVVDREALRNFLERLTYPLYYLDFETFSTAVPPYDGLRPHAHVPFQYSLHVQREPGTQPEHSGFLAEPGEDPRPALLERLIPETAGEGSILAYHASFEVRVLRALAASFPEHGAAIEDRLARIVDLIEPFKKRWLYLPAMNGSASLKSVLPALAPDLSYEGMEIADGTQAMEAFLALREQHDAEAIRQVRQALWDYCELDTLGMVRIVDELWRRA